MRAVVTGGAGFLGSHLCDRLIAEGWDVLSLDNLVTGVDANVAHLQKHPRFRTARADVSNYIDVAGAGRLRLALASPASPVDYLRMPIQTFEGWRVGYTQCPRSRAGEESQIFPGLNQRVLRRPGSFAAARNILGSCEFDWPPWRLR